MTAEIFLAIFLASLLVALVQWVFLFTVYRPVQRWLSRRAFQRSVGNGGDFVSLGSDDVCGCGAVPMPGVLDKAAFESHQRQFDAERELCMAALDVTDDLRVEGGQSAGRLLAAVVAYRQETPARTRKAMRAMAAFRKVQHEPDDPV